MTQETPSCHLGLKQIQGGFIKSVEKSPTSCEEYGRIEGVRIESVLTLFRCGYAQVHRCRFLNQECLKPAGKCWWLEI